jgi:hypothetical protein
VQAGRCGSQMGKKFWKVVCGEHGIGGVTEHAPGYPRGTFSRRPALPQNPP